MWEACGKRGFTTIFDYLSEAIKLRTIYNRKKDIYINNLPEIGFAARQPISELCVFARVGRSKWEEDQIHNHKQSLDQLQDHVNVSWNKIRKKSLVMNKYGEIKTTISENIYFLPKNKCLLILWFLFLNLSSKLKWWLNMVKFPHQFP